MFFNQFPCWTVVLHASHGKYDHIVYNSPAIMNIRTFVAKSRIFVAKSATWFSENEGEWFPSHGMFVMMVMMRTIMSEQGTLLIISQIYFHYLLCQRSVHNVFKTIWIWFHQASLSEMIIKAGIRGVAWGTPRHQLPLFCSALWGIVALRGRWLT